MDEDPDVDSVENDSDQAAEESARDGPGSFVAGVAIGHGDGDTAGSPDEGRDRERGATGSEHKRDHDKKRNKTHDCIRSNGRTNCSQESFSRDIWTMSPIERLYPASHGKTMGAPASVDMRMCDSRRRGAQGIDLSMHESSSAPSVI